MPLEHWLSFAVAAAFWLAVPGRAGLLAASYAARRGRLIALVTVPGLVLGMLASLLVACHLAWLAAAVSGSLLTTLKWTGALVLAAVALRFLVHPALSGPFADNDNFPQAKPFMVFLDVFSATFLNRRNLVFFIAFAPQFLTPAAPWQPQVVILCAALSAVSLAAAVLLSLFSRPFLRHVRKTSAPKPLQRCDGMVSIASGAVTVGHRRIAA